MKSTGIVRKVDELGRIVLPIEKKYKPSCVFCDATKDITVFKGKNICPKCLKELKEL